MPELYVIALCGAGDRPGPDDPTPLERAHVPHLDALAARGVSGLLTVIDADTPPESDSGAMALLGYDPLAHYPGRGPLEGLGTGFLQPRSDRWTVCFRMNMASVDTTHGRFDRRTARDLTDPELQALLDEVRARVSLADHDARFELVGFGRHRGILAFHRASAPLSGEISNTDPEYGRVGPFGIPRESHEPRPLPCEPLDDSPAARDTAAIVNAFVERSAAVLDASVVNARRRAEGRLPANRIIVRDGGDRLTELQPFRQRHGRALTIHGQVPAERGLAQLLGARYADARQPAGSDEADYYAELAARLAADPADVVYVHVKGPDEAAHDGDADGKVDALQRLDRLFLARLLPLLGDAATVVVTGDHATPWRAGIHTADPVPLVVAGPGVTPDGCTTFSERSAAERGGFGHHRACTLLDTLLSTLANAPDGAR